MTLVEPTLRTAAGAVIANVLPPISDAGSAWEGTMGVLEIVMMSLG